MTQTSLVNVDVELSRALCSSDGNLHYNDCNCRRQALQLMQQSALCQLLVLQSARVKLELRELIMLRGNPATTFETVAKLL